MFEFIQKVGPLLFCGNVLVFLIDGYNTSNIANVHVPIYNALGKIQVLPWVNLAYALTAVAFVPVARKLSRVCKPKTLGFAGSICGMLGSLCVACASNMETLLLGRIIMALGSVVLDQVVLVKNKPKVPRREFTKVQALTGIFFPLGLFMGPLISGALVEAKATSWRWAFLIVTPVLLVSAVLMSVGNELRSLQLDEVEAEKQGTQSDKESMMTHSSRGVVFKTSEWIGIISWITFFILFGLGCTFPGSFWAWGTAPTVVVWVLLDIVAGILTAYTLLQQTRMRKGEQQDTAIPILVAGHSGVFFAELCVFLASIGLATTLYYTPIYFTVAHRDNALDAAKHLLPLMGVFIVAILVSGYIARGTRIQPLLIATGAVLLTIGAGLQQRITVDTSISRIMGYEAVIGAGVGLIWQTTLAMSLEVLESADDQVSLDERIDVIDLHKMAQMGGIAVGTGIAGSIYQNIGVTLLRSAVFPEDLPAQSLRELLFGANSTFSLTHPELYAGVLGAATETIRRCLCVNIAAGVMCLACSSFMSLKQAFGQKAKSQSVMITEAETRGRLFCWSRS